MNIATLERKLRPYEDPIKNAFLKWLYTHFPPRPLTNKKMFEHYREAARILMLEMEKEEFPATVRSVIQEYLNSVFPFIEDYEKKSSPLEGTTPEEMLRFLLEQNDLSQYDIASEVGGQPVVSDILNGKRKLTRDHIERLSKRFGIRPSTFFSN